MCCRRASLRLSMHGPDSYRSRGFGRNAHRQKSGAGFYLAKPSARLAPPTPQQSSADIVPPRGLRDGGPRRLQFRQNAQLLFGSASPPLLDPGDDLHRQSRTGVVRLLVGGREGADLVGRSCCCSRTGYIAPCAEGCLPEGAVFGGRCEMAAKLEVGVNAAIGG
jgi:hypothetical protein